MQVKILCDQNITGSSVTFVHSCLLHHNLCMCVDQLWLNVQIKSEFMNDAFTNLSIF